MQHEVIEVCTFSLSLVSGRPTYSLLAKEAMTKYTIERVSQLSRELLDLNSQAHRS